MGQEVTIYATATKCVVSSMRNPAIFMHEGYIIGEKHMAYDGARPKRFALIYIPKGIELSFGGKIYLVWRFYEIRKREPTYKYLQDIGETVLLETVISKDEVLKIYYNEF